MTKLPIHPKNVPAGPKSTANGLSQRGQELAASGSMLDKFKAILGNPYDPDTNPDGIVNIGTAENYIMLPEVAAFADKKVEALKPAPEDFSYGQGPWGTPRLREAMAQHINRHFHPLRPVESQRILFANGVTSICEMLGFTICEPGDAILLSRPIYQAFKADFGSKARVQCVYTSFGDVDQFSPEGIKKYEEAILTAEKEGNRIRALIACSPHNPLGRCYPPESLIAFMELCNKYKIHLLVDEIYALSVYDIPDPKAVGFRSILTFETAKYIDPRYLHLLYGMSKDMAGGGLRLGCIYTLNEDLMRAMSVISPFHWSGGGNEKIAATMLEDTDWMDSFLALSRERLAAGNIMVRQILDEAGIGYYEGSNAGLFIWVDLRPYVKPIDGQDGWAAEDALTVKLLKSGVFMTNGKELSAEEPGWYRLIFSQREEFVREGIKRMLKVVRSESVSNTSSH